MVFYVTAPLNAILIVRFHQQIKVIHYVNENKFIIILRHDYTKFIICKTYPYLDDPICEGSRVMFLKRKA